MKWTSQAEKALADLPLAGANVLVDALIEEPRQAEAFVQQVRDLVGGAGTIVMPSFTDTWTLIDTAAAPQPFHAELQLSPRLGAAADSFRRQAGVLRSGHPSHSFAACGPQAHDVLSTNRDNNPLGPVKKLNVMNGLTLAVGCNAHGSTALHLAEELALPDLRYRGSAKRINIAGYEERIVVDYLPACTQGYDTLEEEIQPIAAHEFETGDAVVRLSPLRALIRTASAAIVAKPEAILCGSSDCTTCSARAGAIASQG